MAFVRLAIEADARTSKDALVNGNPIVAEPLVPPIVVWIDQIQLRQVARFQLATELRLSFRNTVRSRHRSEARLEQLVMLQTFPITPASADCDIGAARSQIDQLIARRHSHREVRMIDLKGAETPGEPGVGERVRRGDGKESLILFAMTCEGRLDRIECAG